MHNKYFTDARISILINICGNILLFLNYIQTLKCFIFIIRAVNLL